MSNDLEIVNEAIEKFNAATESGYTVVGVPMQNDSYKEKLVMAMSEKSFCAKNGLLYW